MNNEKPYTRRKKSDTEWRKYAGNLLKAELKRKGMTYADLAEKLKEIGIEENGQNIGNTLSRGAFSFIFALQCFKVIGVKEIRLD